jgi:2',3'-cyclic-nucleotide 2'-phosphodiesterase (5'-nucleotidase family)
VKRAFLLVLVSGLILAVVCPLFPEKITLIHSNDTHGNFKSYMTKVDGGEKLIF